MKDPVVLQPLCHH